MCGICLLIVCASPGLAGTLDATVLGANGQPKSFVRIEIGGLAGGQTLFTGPNGRFQVELSVGSYTIEVYERSRGMQFDFDMPEANTDTTETFQVSW